MDKKDIEKYTNELPKLEKLVLTLKFGLDGYPPLSNKQIAQKLKLPVTVISSIENSAIQTLRIRDFDKRNEFDFEQFNKLTLFEKIMTILKKIMTILIVVIPIHLLLVFLTR